MNRSATKTVFVGLLCLSIALPIGIVLWSMKSAFEGRTPGYPAREDPVFEGSAVKGHELWHVATPWGPDRFQQVPKEWRVHRLDLETGVDQSTDLTAQGEFCECAWVAETLFLYTGTTLYQWNGTSLITIPGAPAPPISLDVNLFVFEGRLTLIDEFDHGRFRLQQLDDGRWIRRGEVAIPHGHARWTFDDDSKPPQICQFPYWTDSDKCQLEVIAAFGKALLSVSGRDFSAFRYGFEFVDHERDIASATTPENAPPVVSGWQVEDYAAERFGMEIYFGDVERVSSSDGLIVRVHDHFIKRSDGIDHELTGTINRSRNTWIIPANDGLPNYVLAAPDWTESYSKRITIQRIVGLRILPPHAEIAGYAGDYCRRLQHLMAGIILGWILHGVIVLAAVNLLIRSNSCRKSVGSAVPIQPASIARRSIAFLVDFGPPSVLIGTAWYITAIRPTFPVVLKLLDLEDYLYRSHDSSIESWHFVQSLIARLISSMAEIPLSMFLILVALIAAWLSLQYWDEGQRGVTPGKWLMGIRTRRTDLRPCGFARSLLRLCLLVLDTGFFLTPLPAAISILSSQENKRLGDRLADTVVVREATP